MSIEQARVRLVGVVRALWPLRAEGIERLRSPVQCAEFDRPDFLWHYLLAGFSTMGGVGGYAGLIGNPANYARVAYAALAALPADVRTAEVNEVCRAAGLRWPNRKAAFIRSAFDRIHALGGPEAARAQLVARPDRASKIAWLTGFDGVSKKYARNLMMDVYHPEFRACIAIDARIKAITRELGLSFRSYEAEEDFYLAVAERAGRNGWELDRLLFNCSAEVIDRLRAAAAQPD